MTNATAVKTGDAVISIRGVSMSYGAKRVLDNVDLDVLGRARKVVVTKDETTIVDGAGDADQISGRVNQIRTEIDNTDSDYDREKLQERLAKLSGGVAVINVGAATETELKEKKARVEDALHATRAAVEEGIVPGGGVALIRAQSALDKIRGTEDEKIGVEIVRRAARLGAVATLVRSITPVSIQSPHTGTLEYTDGAPKIPAAAVTIEDALMIQRLVDTGNPVTVHLEMEAHTLPDADSANVIGEIPGREKPEEVVGIGGHLDSWASGTGATDNGAGTIVAMEVMRILNALKVQPRRTIRVALWTGEEQGEFGSYGYVKQHFGYVPLSEAPDQIKLPDFLRKPAGPVVIKPEQSKISGYFNVDNGTGKIRGIYLQENAAIAQIFQQWIAPLGDLGVSTITMRNTGGTDHEAFDSVGIPGFQFIQDMLDYGSRTHHSNMDVYERLQKSDLMQASVVMATFVYQAAMRDGMIPRKPLPKWEPPKEEPGKGPPAKKEDLEKDRPRPPKTEDAPTKPTPTARPQAALQFTHS